MYSFYSAIQKGELTPLGCVEKAAELGFDAVEAVDFVNFSGTQEEKKAQALELKQAAEKCGLKFSSLAIGADFLNGSDGDQEKEIQRVKDYVDIAALLGAPRMRHDITAGYKGENYRSYASLIPSLAQAVREVADYAASKGVMTMTEDVYKRQPTFCEAICLKLSIFPSSNTIWTPLKDVPSLRSIKPNVLESRIDRAQPQTVTVFPA